MYLVIKAHLDTTYTVQRYWHLRIDLERLLKRAYSPFNWSGVFILFHIAASIVFGIPTIKRDKASYLYQTLKSLIDGLSTPEKEESLIVVFIAEVCIIIWTKIFAGFLEYFLHNIDSLCPSMSGYYFLLKKGSFYIRGGLHEPLFSENSYNILGN